jgi:hypothetical protein
MSPIHLIPNALSELFAQVSTTGQITLADRYGLMAVILTETATEEELRAMDRLLHALCRGRVKIVSELSTVIV